MPMEASSLVGSLGGIGELARSVFGDDGNGPVVTRPGGSVPSA